MKLLNSITIGINNMANTQQLEMKIHEAKDKLGTIEAKVNLLEARLMNLVDRVNESQALFDKLKEKV